MSKTEDTPTRAKRRFKISTTSIFLLIALAGFATTFTVASANSIPSSSMESTIMTGEQVMVNKLDRTPERGDIVVFEDHLDWLGPEYKSGTLMIKRVIGLPGDTVTCCTADVKTRVNGVVLDEPYAVPETPENAVQYEVTVPEGSMFVLGDNRPNSADSRFHLEQGSEFVSQDSIVGTAYAVRWPLTKFRLLGDH